MKCSHRSVMFWQVLVISLVGILPPGLCGLAYSGVVNPFDFFFNRAVITTKAGETTTVDRELARLTFPPKFIIGGTLPQGEVDFFSMVLYNTDKLAMAIKGTNNPFGQITMAAKTHKEKATSQQILDKTGMELQPDGKWKVKFLHPDFWKPGFFPWHQGDKFKPYKTAMFAGSKLTFDGFEALSKIEYFTVNKVSALLFAVAPKDDVQNGVFSRAHIVVVNVK